jgi:hypothetical protein
MRPSSLASRPAAAAHIVKPRAPSHVQGFDPGRRWPEVTYILPAYLNNEAAILDDTMQSYLRLRCPAPLNIMIVYNAKRRLPREERALKRAWHGFRQGNFRVTVVQNNTCAPPHAALSPGWVHVVSAIGQVCTLNGAVAL